MLKKTLDPEKLKVKYVLENQKDLSKNEILDTVAHILDEVNRFCWKLKKVKKYKRVVDIAANHHEKLNGKGYPRGLSAKDLSVEERLMAIADIFEALSAKDRPYKEPK